MQIREQETDFDYHLEMIENSDGEVFFFDVHSNPARFSQQVVDTVIKSEPPEVLLVFHKGCGEKKSRSIARSASRRITKALDCHYYKTHLFILPGALFDAAQTEVNRQLN